MGKQKENLMNAFETLRSSLKEASIQAIQQDKYGESRQLSEIMEQLASLENRASAVLGGKLPGKPDRKSSSTEMTEPYPRFYRVGETLYKEGMKQDGKSIYTQKVDRQSFEAIVAAVAAYGKRKFKPADLIGKLEQPSYQVYIALKVLQDAELLRNPERGFYQLAASVKALDGGTVWGSIEQQHSH